MISKKPVAELARILMFSSRNHEIDEETDMKSALIGATANVAAACTTPALAQAVIDNPSMCSQLYPKANCEDPGPGNPYIDGGYWRKGDASSERPWQLCQAISLR
jgi:hypothetical protein